jgi:hypothetical protein
VYQLKRVADNMDIGIIERGEITIDNIVTETLSGNLYERLE